MKQGILIFSMIMAAGVLALGAPSPAPAKAASPKKDDKKDQSPLGNLLGGGTKSNEPTTTEIYADEAFFDSAKSMGIFSGHVKVVDPRFNLQSDKLTVFISKSQTAKNADGQASPGPQATPAPGEQAPQGQGLEKAIAEGNVGVVRDRPDPNGGPPTRAVGRADMATYTAATGNVELKGTPRVQQGENMHIATSPDTVMLINQNGQLTTHGPSRTEIRQQPKDDDKKDGEDKGDDKAEKKGEGKGKGNGKGKAEKSPGAKP